MRPVVLTVEQALSMSHATLRLVPPGLPGHPRRAHARFMLMIVVPVDVFAVDGVLISRRRPAETPARA